MHLVRYTFGAGQPPAHAALPTDTHATQQNDIRGSIVHSVDTYVWCIYAGRAFCMHGVTVHGSIDMRCGIIVRTYNKNRACTTSALLRLSLSHHLACCLLGTLRVCAREERDRTTVNAFFLSARTWCLCCRGSLFNTYMMLVTVSDGTTASVKEVMHWQNVLIQWPPHCSNSSPW